MQSYLLFHQQIGSFSLELFMGLLLSLDDNITWLNTWILISLAMESILVIVGGAFVDFSFQYFLLFYYLLAIADFAFIFIVDDLTCATTFIARALGLTVHAGSEHSHLHDHASTFTSIALLNGAFLATYTITSYANTLSVDCNFCCLSRVDFFER